mgnify:FL=1
MRRHMAQRLSLLAALSGLVWSQVANAQRIQADPPEHYTIPLAMEPLERHGIPLQEAHIILAQGPDGAAGAVAVVLHKTKYMCRLFEASPSGSHITRTALWCYEMNAQRLHTWSICGGPHLRNFRLFPHGPGENYLTWVDGSLVVAAEVSDPRDRCVALAQRLLQNAPFMTVPVPVVVPDIGMWGVDALYTDIRVQSLRKTADGTYEMRISNPEGTESYTLVGQGHEWRVAEPEKEPEAHGAGRSPETGEATGAETPPVGPAD